MSARWLALFAFLSFSALAADPGNFLLGQDYREWLPPNARALATDKTGAIYVLSAAGISGNTPPSSVVKLSPDGKTVVWQNQLGIAVSSMAVDPDGGVYVTPVNLAGPVSVAKLNDNGVGFAWTAPAGFSVPFGFLPVLAAGPAGPWVAGFDTTQKTTFIRMNTDGVVSAGLQLTGMPTSLVVDPSGAALLASAQTSGLSLTRINAIGTIAYQTPFAAIGTSPTIALDTSSNPNGNGVVYSAGTITRFDAGGAVISSKTLTPNINSTVIGPYLAFAVDAAGNGYAIGSSPAAYYPTKNSIATCGSEFLIVTAPDGTVLQTTYLQNATPLSQPSIAVRGDGAVLLVDFAPATSTPSRVGPFANAGFQVATGSVLVQLSPNHDAATFPIVCATNGASFQTGLPSPGELITLFGSGLGPAIAVAANVQSTLPTQLGDVQVTFDGKPAPLMWAQDSQINLVTPQALQPGGGSLICVTKSGTVQGCLSVGIAQTTPGVFTYDGTYAAALNQDGSVNSATNPAAPNSVVSIFATGTGPITPAQPDGTLIGFPLPSNMLQATVSYRTGGQIGGLFGGGALVPVSTQTLYSGPAPDRIAGITQINFRLANSTSYFVQVGAASSQSFIVHVAGQ